MTNFLAIFLVSLAAHVVTNIAATDLADNHLTAFGSQIPSSSGLDDEEQHKLQLVDASPQDEGQQSAENVKKMFSNIFNSIKTQREQARAAQQTA